MSDTIESLVIEKLAQADKKFYTATNGAGLILAEDGKTLWIGNQPGNDPSDDDVLTAMQEFLNS